MKVLLREDYLTTKYHRSMISKPNFKKSLLLDTDNTANKYQNPGMMESHKQ